MKDKIVIIGANDYQLQLILKAKEKNYETHVFAWEEGAVAKEYADYFYPVSIVNKDKILDYCKVIKPSGIVSIASDLAVGTVNYLANELGLIGNPVETTLCCTNKYEMRKKLMEAGTNCPQFMEISKIEEIGKCQIPLPTIVKPTDRSGSRAITLITDREQYQEAVMRAVNESFGGKAIVESFIKGIEYSVEYISQNGEHNFLAITQKITTGEPHYIEKGHIQPANVSMELKEKIQIEVEKGIRALGIMNGATHTEVIVSSDNTVSIVEIGARMGGDYIGSDLVMLSTGIDFTGLVIDVACNKKIEVSEERLSKRAEVHFIFDKDDLRALDKLKEQHPEKIHRVQIETNVGNHEVIDSSSRFGYYIIKDVE